MINTFCPVCGYKLGFEAWKDKSPSDEICPSCGIQFGYDDFGGGDLNKRSEIYFGWRKKWISEGMRWCSKGQTVPKDWDPEKQLKNVI